MVNPNANEQSEDTRPGSDEQTRAQGESPPADKTEIARHSGIVIDRSGQGKEEIGDDARAAIFAAGHEAGKAKLDPAHCPYSEDDERAAIWLRGHTVGKEEGAPEKPTEIDEAARIPDRFRILVPGRIVHYARRRGVDEIVALPAIVVMVVNQAEGLVSLQVFENSEVGLTFARNVSYEPSGDLRNTWRWPQGE